MIFCFSGTGNSYLVAKRLVKQMDTCIIDMNHDVPNEAMCAESEMIGFVLPVYAWGLPLVVARFVARLPRVDMAHKYVYAVLTCGDDMGYTDALLRQALQQVGWTLHATYVIQMRNTYVCLPGFDVDAPEVVQRKTSTFDARLRHIATCIAQRMPANEKELRRGGVPWVKSYILRPLFNRFLINDRYFKVNADACARCGRCAKQCPTGNMRMDKDGLPQWCGTQCTHCLRCYHICPRHAINFGKFTRGKGQVKINL